MPLSMATRFAVAHLNRPTYSFHKEGNFIRKWQLARDDFNAATVRKLRDRVAHRCSNPDCRVPTSSPRGDSDVSNIGTAAHICAAAPGGPRYKASMSKYERSSIKNGIWLCTNCSREIDNDVSLYPEKILQNWKATAEETAKKELGNKLPKNDDAINQMTTALAGVPQKSFLAAAISNVHVASAEALKKLDNRFEVDSEYKSGVSSFTIKAKEKVQVVLNVEAPFSKSFSDKYRDLIEKGKDFEIPTEGISASGSELLGQIMKESSRLKITAPKKTAIQKMSLFQESTGFEESLDDVKGSISLGSHSLNFDGLSCSGVFKVHYNIPIDGKSKKTKFSISLQFDQWNGKDIRLLPFHEKLLETFSRLRDGWKLITALEVDGIEIFRSTGMQFDDLDYVLEISSFLYYTEVCKKIAAAFSQIIKFKSDVSYTEEEFSSLARIVSDIEKKEGYSQGDLKGNASFELVITDPDETRKFLESKEAASIKFAANTGEFISLFDTHIPLPPLTIEQGPVILNVIGDYDDMKAGDTVTIELVPQENYRCIFKYETQHA